VKLVEAQPDEEEEEEEEDDEEEEEEDDEEEEAEEQENSGFDDDGLPKNRFNTCWRASTSRLNATRASSVTGSAVSTFNSNV
jgi:hypothetical protein